MCGLYLLVLLVRNAYKTQSYSSYLNQLVALAIIL